MRFTEHELKNAIRLEGCLPEPPSVVSSLELRLGVLFPETLKAVWAIEEEITVLCDTAFIGGIGFGLFALRTKHFQYISSTVEDSYKMLFEERYPGIIPIGNEGNGDLLALDYRRHLEPVVLKYDHEIDYDENIPFYFLARDFDEFIARAQPNNRLIFEEADSKILEEELTEFLGFSAKPSFAYRSHHQRGKQD